MVDLITLDAPDAMALVHFLRRFADLMSNGQNAAYLQRAAGLLETLTAQLTAASDEENLWRYKYETLNCHADALEAQCEDLKDDIEGHVDITTSILAERDMLKTTLQIQQTELDELRVASDLERKALEIAVEKSAEELRELRLTCERERDEFTNAINAGENNLAELRLSLQRERAKFQGELKARYDELEALRVASRSESDELKASIGHLEAKRTELRHALERIGNLKSQELEPCENLDPTKLELEVSANTKSVQPNDQNPVAEEIDATEAIVSRAMLRQARAQFAYLAKECVVRGDIASQVMCALGANILDSALSVRRRTDQQPVIAVALNILTHPGSTSLVVAETMRACRLKVQKAVHGN